MKKKKIKNDNDIYVSFVDSPSAEDVTGSMVYIKTPKHKILLDCGIHQTNDRYDDFLVNNRKIKEFKPSEIDYIFISHLHMDHVGMAPKLYKNGCDAYTIISQDSGQILKDMLMDSANINCRDIVLINAQHNKNYEPLYEPKDVENMMNSVAEFSINEKHIIDDELAFELIPSGHLLGGCQIKLYLTVNGQLKTILYTGDIGNKIVENAFVDKYQQVDSSTLVIAESTYGDRPDIKTGKKERKNDLEKLKSIIDTQVREMKGRVVIPTFAQSRCQQLAFFIYELYKDSDWKPKVYIDSPLAIKIFEDYLDVLNEDEKMVLFQIMNSENFVFVREAAESKTVVSSNEPCIVLSSSGMCTVGRIRHHLKKVIPDPNSTVLFVGFSTEGSLAAMLKDPKNKTVTIDQKEYKCKCSVYSLKSLSGHAPFSQLVDDYTNINTCRIILHHGAKAAKENLKRTLDKEFEKKCKSTRVIITNAGYKTTL